MTHCFFACGKKIKLIVLINKICILKALNKIWTFNFDKAIFKIKNIIIFRSKNKHLKKDEKKGLLLCFHFLRRERAFLSLSRAFSHFTRSFLFQSLLFLVFGCFLCKFILPKKVDKTSKPLIGGLKNH